MRMRIIDSRAPRLDVDVAGALLVGVEEEELGAAMTGSEVASSASRRERLTNCSRFLMSARRRRSWCWRRRSTSGSRRPRRCSAGCRPAPRGSGVTGPRVSARSCSSSSSSKGLATATASAPSSRAERQDAVLAGEGAGDGGGDELGVELEAINLAVAEVEPPGDGGGGLVLVDLSAGACGARRGGGARRRSRSARSPPCRAPARRAGCARG